MVSAEMANAARRLSSLSLCAAGSLALGLASPSTAASGRGPLRYSEDYIAYRCAEPRLSDRYAPLLQLDRSDPAAREKGRAQAEAIEADRAQLRKRYEHAIDFPYPEEFRGYKPRGHELLELHRGTD